MHGMQNGQHNPYPPQMNGHMMNGGVQPQYNMNTNGQMSAMQQQQFMQIQQMQRQQNQRYMNNNQNNNYRQHNGNHRKSSNQNGNNKGQTKDTWISPMETTQQNMDFFIHAYKTQACPLRRNCQSKVTCPRWHHEGEKRRNPGQGPDYLYSEEPCPNVKPQGSSKWQPPSRCPDGDTCGYAHTLLEQMYHPNIYKTSMCINYTNPKGNQCQWGFYCTHAHGPDDIRSKEDDEEPKICPIAKPNKTNNNAKQDLNSYKAKLTNSQQKRPQSKSDAPRMYNGHDNRSPNRSPHAQFVNPMMQTQPQNPTTHRMSPSMVNNIAQFPPSHQAMNGSYNHSRSPNMPQQHPVAMNAHSADFSPLPYQAPNNQKYAGNPPPIALHDPNALYHSQSTTTYHAEQSFVAQQQTKRGRSITAPQLEGVRGHVSRSSNVPNMYQNNYTINEQHNPSSQHKNGNTSTPPPMTAKQMNNYYVNYTAADHSTLPYTTRQSRSISVGGMLLDSEQLPNPMHKTVSLPAADLPSEEANYFILKTPKELGKMKRPWSKSEPLAPEKPQFDMVNNIWRTDDKAKSGLKSIPDNGVTSPSTTATFDDNKSSKLFSPGTQKLIDTIITPKKSIVAVQSPADMSKTESYNDYFGFKNSKGDITLPKTPPFIPARSNEKRKEDEVSKLKQQIKNLQLKLAQSSSTKRSESKNGNDDDAKDKEEPEEIVEKLTIIHKQKLARYSHFLTCPGCGKFDPTTPRNTVLIPCGHLVCGKCSKQFGKAKQCSLCKKKIKSTQILVIG